MLSHDIVGQGQPEPGALIGGLGGEEGVEDLFHDISGNAAPVVPHTDFDPVLQTLGAEPQGRAVGGKIHSLGAFPIGLFSSSRPQGAPFLIGGIAGVADQVQEDTSHVLGHDVNGLHLRVQILPDVQVERLVGGPGTVVGKSGALIEQAVDVGRLPLTRISSHQQHVVYHPVGAIAVVADALEISGEISGDLTDQLSVLLAQFLLVVGEDLPQFLQ